MTCVADGVMRLEDVGSHASSVGSAVCMMLLGGYEHRNLEKIRRVR